MHEPGRPTPAALWGPVVAYMAVIFGFSSLQSTPPLPGGSDKVLHALLYSGLGVLLARAAGGGARGVTGRIIVWTTIVGGLYGVSDEVHQYFNPPRAVEAADVLADTVGSCAGAVLLHAWGIIRARNGL